MQTLPVTVRQFETSSRVLSPVVSAGCLAENRLVGGKSILENKCPHLSWELGLSLSERGMNHGGCVAGRNLW